MSSKLPDDRRAMFTDAYRFYEEHWDMPDTAEAWEEAASQLCPIINRYNKHPLIRNLIMALYDTMDEECKEIRRAIG